MYSGVCQYRVVMYSYLFKLLVCHQHELPGTKDLHTHTQHIHTNQPVVKCNHLSPQ